MYSLDDFDLRSPTSPVSDEAFHSVYTLTSDETSTVQVALGEASLQWSSLNVKIKELKKLIAVYEDVQRQVSYFISRHAYLISAIRRLPPELLIEIFRWNIFGNPPNSSRKEKLAPLLLSQVCKKWRFVLGHTPNLWTCVEADLTDGHKHEDQLVDLWLRRSKEQALDIKVRLAAHRTDLGLSSARKAILGPEEQATVSNKTCEILLRQSPRWRTFRIRAQRALPPCFCHPILLPLLVRADIEVHGSHCSTVAHLLQVLQKAEALQVFNLEEKAQFHSALPSILVDQPSSFRKWTSVREMDLQSWLGGTDSVTVVEILRRSPRLERFAVKVYPSRITDHLVFNEPFLHDTLQSLHVHGYVSFLRALEAPNLKELKVHPMLSPDSPDFEDAVRSFLRRTGRVECLVIDDIHPSCIEHSWNTIHYLRMSMNIDSLTHLDLMESWGDQSSCTVSPSLRTLYLRVYPDWMQEVDNRFFSAVHHLAKQLSCNATAGDVPLNENLSSRAFPALSVIYVDLEGGMTSHTLNEVHSRSETLIKNLRESGLVVSFQRMDLLIIASEENITV